MAEYSCLIVEDSPMMRQLLVFALARVKNLRVTEADDGVDGLRKLASTEVRRDHHRHQHAHHGRAEAGEARAHAIRCTRTRPIIIITTEGSQEDRQRALQLGANAYITKPIQAPQVDRQGQGAPQDRPRRAPAAVSPYPPQRSAAGATPMPRRTAGAAGGAAAWRGALPRPRPTWSALRGSGTQLYGFAPNFRSTRLRPVRFAS